MTKIAPNTQRRRDSRQLCRQWALLQLLAASRRWFSAKELAEQLVSSKATIQRDLATIGSEFALIEESSGKQKKLYRIDQNMGALGAITFGAMELLSLHAALEILEPLAGSPVYQDLESVVRKVRGFLAPKHNGGLDLLADVFSSRSRGHVDYEPHRETLDDLVDAIAQRRVCQALYRGASAEPREHVIHPLKMVWHDGVLYIFCCIPPHKSVARLAVHRIVSLEKMKSRFRRPQQLVKDMARRGFGIYENPEEEEDVEIVFSEKVAWRIAEKVWHPAGRKTELSDGRLRFQMRTSARVEVISWVLGYGGEAELVGPAAWRVELVERALNAGTAHRSLA